MDKKKFLIIIFISDIEMAQLQVTVVEAKNLKKKDLFSDNDPFVQVYLDDINFKQKTKTKKNSKNPRWNQSFFL